MTLMIASTLSLASSIVVLLDDTIYHPRDWELNFIKFAVPVNSGVS
jgi:hypothetical protein